MAVACKSHGRSECEEVCKHLAAAIRAGTRLPPMTCYVVMERPIEKWLCHACVHEHGLPNPARPISEAESIAPEFATEPVCVRCFAVAVKGVMRRPPAHR